MRTLTSASRRLAPSKIASGERPLLPPVETWASTLGWVGAVRSLTISQRGAAPVSVIETVQPGGVLPSGKVSKLITLPAGASRLNDNSHASAFILMCSQAMQENSPSPCFLCTTTSDQESSGSDNHIGGNPPVHHGDTLFDARWQCLGQMRPPTRSCVRLDRKSVV